MTHEFCTRKPIRTRAVHFGILDPDTIRRMAVCEVKNPLVYCRGLLPMMEGVIDHRMGSCDRRLRCGTCNHSVQDCPGHCGFIDLGVPMYVGGYLDVCLKVLRSVCYFCSSLLLDEAAALAAREGITPGKAAFLAVYAAARTRKQCHRCGGPQPQYARVPMGIRAEWPDDATGWTDDAERDEVVARTFTSVEAASILRSVSDDDVRLLSLDPERAHPAWMVPDVLCVPPSAMRPSIMNSSASRLRGQDEITLALNMCNKRAAELRAHIQATGWTAADDVSTEMAEKMARLQADISALMFSSPTGGGGAPPPAVASSSSRKRAATITRGIAYRLKGDQRARTVPLTPLDSSRLVSHARSPRARAPCAQGRRAASVEIFRVRRAPACVLSPTSRPPRTPTRTVPPPPPPWRTQASA